MRSSFTLIEVMIAIVIISIVGMGLLQIHSNQTKTFEFAIDRIDVNEKASILFANYSESLDDKDRTLMDIVKSKYPDFRNDDLEIILKNENVLIKKEEIAQIYPFSFEDNESEEEDDFLDEDDEMEQEEPILLYRFDARFENAGTYIYSFGYEGVNNQIPTISGNENESGIEENKDKETKGGKNNPKAKDVAPKTDGNMPPPVGGRK